MGHIRRGMFQFRDIREMRSHLKNSHVKNFREGRGGECYSARAGRWKGRLILVRMRGKVSRVGRVYTTCYRPTSLGDIGTILLDKSLYIYILQFSLSYHLTSDFDTSTTITRAREKSFEFTRVDSPHTLFFPLLFF